MTDHWQEHSTSSTQVINDDDAPEDWETALDEKPKTPIVEEKPKVPSTTKKRADKKNYTNDEESGKIVKQTDGDNTSEELDKIKQKEEQVKSNMVSELVDKDGKLRSLDDLILCTRDEFLNYSLRLSDHIGLVSNSKFFPDFVEHFLNGITKSMSTEGVKRLSEKLEAIKIRKENEEREKRAKLKPKKQNKPKLKTVRPSDYGDAGVNDYDQDNDFDDEDFS